MTSTSKKLAIHGGPKTVTLEAGDIFKWPIVTEEDEAAVLEVIRRGAMSGWDVTEQFESEFAEWMGTDYALCFGNGTMGLLAAMFGCGLGAGDEIIGPSLTYWATILPALNLRAVPVLAEVDPDTLCIDPDDIEHRITERTKAVIITHHFAHPCDMDRIMPIAREHGLKLIEDVSHAQGGLYKGRKLGTFGDVGAMSLMAGKSFPIGEGGIFVTDDRMIWERAIAFGHYARTQREGVITDPELARFKGMPLGGFKFRLNQTASAMGRVQLKYYDERCAEIRRAMNHFWDCLDGCPGLQAHRVDEETGSTMAGWYAAVGLLKPDEIGGVTNVKFAEAVRAEGAFCRAYCGNTSPIHMHPILREADVYKEGKPTAIAYSERTGHTQIGDLPVTEAVMSRIISVPRFKRFGKEFIEQQAAAFRKVAENYEERL